MENRVRRVMDALIAVQDPLRKEKAASYYPTAMQVIGIATPDIHRITRAIVAENKGLPARSVLEFAHELVRTDVHEARQVAYELLWRIKAARALITAHNLETLGSGNDNWVSVDTFSVLVSGPVWRVAQVPDPLIHHWARSSDRWWRRTAVVSTVALNLKSRGGTGDLERTIEVCRLVAADHDDMVVKGLSWALRELSKRYVQPVRDFLEEHDDILAGRVKREVTRKIVTGRKSG